VHSLLQLLVYTSIPVSVTTGVLFEIQFVYKEMMNS
jgi:hypothetical protein